MRHKIMILVVLFFITSSCIGFAADSKSPPIGVYSLLLSTQGLSVVKPPVIVPRDEKYRPFKKKRFIPFSRQMEYLQIGYGYKEETQHNLFVIDPLKYNFDPDDPGTPVEEPIGANDLIDKKYNEYFSESYKKTAASGMMDDDIQDETAVVCWPARGSGKLVIINPTGEPDSTTFYVNPITLALDIGGHQDLAYDYDITLGDVDGDGYDEIVIAGSIAGATSEERHGKLWIVDDVKTGYALINSRIVHGSYGDSAGDIDGDIGVDQLKVAAGNVDQDWADEITIAFAALSQGNSEDSGTIHYMVIDDSDESFAVINEGEATELILNRSTGGRSTPYVYGDPMQGTFINYFNVAMGDMDRDGRDEIAIGYRTHDIIEKSPPSSDHPDGIWEVQEQLYLEVIDDAVGQDGYEAGEDRDLGDAFLVLNGTYGKLMWSGYNNISPYVYVDYFKFFDVVDIDGDKADEIFVGWAIIDDVNPNNENAFTTVTHPYNPDHPDSPSEDPETAIIIRPWGWVVPELPADKRHYLWKINHISFGDVNGDLREDITLLVEQYDPHLNEVLSGIQTIGFQYNNIYDTSTSELERVDDHWRSGGTKDEFDAVMGFPSLDARLHWYNSFRRNTIIVPANVDGDSTIIEYSADTPGANPTEQAEFHTVYYNRNQIIALLASPPAIDNINTYGTSTSFGLSATNSIGSGAHGSLRAGVLFGAEADLSVGFIVSTKIGSVEAEVEAEIEAAHSVSTSVSVTKSMTYTTGDKEDLVVFSTTPYDSYLYFLASHPRPVLIGTKMFFDIPQAPKVLAWTRKYYNDHNGNQLDIGEDIFRHTPGDISTYLNRAGKDNILAQTTPPGPSSVPLINDGQWWLVSQVTSLSEYGPHTVQQGSGSHTSELALENENNIEGSVTGSVDYMSKGCLGGICFGNTYGFSVGLSSSYELAEGITFSANVSAIQGDPWGLDSYEYGIFAYKQKLTDDETNITHDFTVVNYWVE